MHHIYGVFLCWRKYYTVLHSMYRMVHHLLYTPTPKYILCLILKSRKPARLAITGYPSFKVTFQPRFIIAPESQAPPPLAFFFFAQKTSGSRPRLIRRHVRFLCRLALQGVQSSAGGGYYCGGSQVSGIAAKSNKKLPPAFLIEQLWLSLMYG